MRLPDIFKNKQRRLFWGAVTGIGLLSVIAFGAAFQNKNSGTILSVPSLWFFGLIILPILLYLIATYLAAKNYRDRP